MTQITIEIESKLAEKMDQLIQFFGSKDLLFKDFMEFHIKKIQRKIVSMRSNLKQYEEQYDMASAEFFEQFENGQLEDSQDFVLWSGIYEMQVNSQKQSLQLS